MAATGTAKAAPMAAARVNFLNMNLSSARKKAHRSKAAGVNDFDQRKNGGARLWKAATASGLKP